MWSLFFLIVTGRALEDDDLAAAEYEDVFAFMYELSKTASFGIKTTEAMHYAATWRSASRRARRHRKRKRQGRGLPHGGRQRRQGLRVRLAHGEIFPSGFLR